VDDAAVTHVDARVVCEMIVEAPVPAEVACCGHHRQTRVCGLSGGGLPAREKGEAHTGLPLPCVSEGWCSPNPT